MTLMRLLLAVLLLLASLPAQAQTVLDAILARGVVRIGLTGDYRPFSIKDPAGTFTGLDVDMAESLARGLGVRLEVVPTAWPTLMADLQSQKFDIGMGGISVTLERAKTAAFSAPVMRTGKAPIARCTDQARFTTLAEIDRPGTRVITNPGGTNERFARANFKSAKIVIYNDNTTIFDEILKGNADVMISESAETIVQQRLRPGLCAVNPDKPLQYGEMAWLLPRGDVAFKAWVDQWLHLAKSTGDYDRIAARWLR